MKDQGVDNIVQIYRAPDPPRQKRRRQRDGWPIVALAAFCWSMRLAVVLLAGMQLRELLGL